MRILVDSCTPVHVREALMGHVVRAAVSPQELARSNHLCLIASFPERAASPLAPVGLPSKLARALRLGWPI